LLTGGGKLACLAAASKDPVAMSESAKWLVAHRVSAAERRRRNRHAGGVLWFTGLPASGKSTIAIAAEKRLFDLGYQVYVLDGDNLRHGLASDLGFAPAARAENLRRAAELAALFRDAGMLVIVAMISPYRADRAHARKIVGAGFHEIHIDAPLAVCERRDPKGLYAKARKGGIADFTGVGAPYEEPAKPELVVNTEHADAAVCTESLVAYVRRNFALAAQPPSA
jgi:bifunctional enzyme CysN/CysC